MFMFAGEYTRIGGTPVYSSTISGVSSAYDPLTVSIRISRSYMEPSIMSVSLTVATVTTMPKAASATTESSTDTISRIGRAAKPASPMAIVRRSGRRLATNAAPSPLSRSSGCGPVSDATSPSASSMMRSPYLRAASSSCVTTITSLSADSCLSSS